MCKMPTLRNKTRSWEGRWERDVYIFVCMNEQNWTMSVKLNEYIYL